VTEWKRLIGVGCSALVAVVTDVRSEEVMPGEQATWHWPHWSQLESEFSGWAG